MLTDSSGNIQEDIDYAPYGTEAYIATETSTNNYKFTGKERDMESGLDYFTARYDASYLGRFTSPDPHNAGAKEEDPQTWNAYSYVRDSPLIMTDPTGLCSDGMDDAAGACQSVGQDVRTNDNPATQQQQQQMDSDQALSGNDPTVTLNLGNTSVTVTYQTAPPATPPVPDIGTPAFIQQLSNDVAGESGAGEKYILAPVAIADGIVAGTAVAVSATALTAVQAVGATASTVAGAVGNAAGTVGGAILYSSRYVGVAIEAAVPGAIAATRDFVEGATSPVAPTTTAGWLGAATSQLYQTIKSLF